MDLYFRTAPRIAAELPQVMGAFFLRLELPLQIPDGLLIVTETAVPPPSPGLNSTLLDLDVIMKNANMDSAVAWQSIEELRAIKNSAFESCITDKARELFE